jgi:adenosylcobinamide-GDP ribazoletransferase
VLGSLILAARFLTILPVPGREASGLGALGRAAWWFPVVGLGLGALLVAFDRVVIRFFPPLLAALLVISAWKVATGGIHLDGLADCLDGLAGSDVPSRLTIMRDSRIGVFGAGGLVLCFLISLTALAELPSAVRAGALLLAPTVGRLAPLAVGACFRAATPGQGAGADFLRSLSRSAGPTHLVLAGALAAALFGPAGALVVVAAVGIAFGWSALLTWRLNGLTGDVLGGCVELAEVAVLLALAALAHQRLV